MKILVGGFRQESNSFSAKISTEETYTVLHGNEFFDPKRNAPTTMLSGLLSGAAENGATVIPSVEYSAMSGGPVVKEVVDTFLETFLSVYDKNVPIDAIFLELHGATDMVGSGDVCGYILETIRAHIAENVILVHSADMHANISDKMIANAHACAAYQTYPHTDLFETGRRTAMHGWMLLNGQPFAEARVRIPMIVPAEGYDTNQGVFADLINRANAMVKNGEIYDYSICQMQPWLDLPDAGSTVLVTAKDRDTAARYAQRLAHEFFDLREKMQIRLYSVDEVVELAKANETDAPVILVDSADSPNAGSGADSSFVLARLLERGDTLRTCLTVADAPAAAHAFEVGVGKESVFLLGGTKEPRFHKALAVRAYVKSLHDGIYQGMVMHKNVQHTGKTAVLQIGAIDVIVFSQMGYSADPQVYRAFGLEPATYRLVMVKSAGQYK
ncbi:MAG: M81 family metallopeptidase, partial [Oscillibacter sp.]|nr:M81 family metallopeptidase [Oscillibacter sp.]